MRNTEPASAARRAQGEEVGEPQHRIDSFVDAWREILATNPQVIRLPLMVQVAGGDHSESILAALRQLMQRARDAIAQGIEDSLGPGLSDLDMVAETILTLLRGALLHRVLNPDDDYGLERIFLEMRRTMTVVLWDRLPADSKHRIPLDAS